MALIWTPVVCRKNQRSSHIHDDRMAICSSATSRFGDQFRAVPAFDPGNPHLFAVPLRSQSLIRIEDRRWDCAARPRRKNVPS